jgi:hypothetical protein
MSFTRLSLEGINLIIPVQGELVSDIPAGDGKTANLFLQFTGTLLWGRGKGAGGGRFKQLGSPRPFMAAKFNF